MIIDWWDDAKFDLEDIYNNIRIVNEKAAVKTYNEIISKAERLHIYAEAFAVEPLIESDIFVFRSCLAVKGRYKIIYFVDKSNDTIVITHVWDCRRNPFSIRKIK